MTDVTGCASRLRDLGRVGKPRVVLLFLFTAWAGSVLASGRLWPDGTPAMLVGLGLAVGGAGALNQYIERDRDGLMARTRGRVLPQGRLPAWSVVGSGAVSCVAGVVLLGVAASPLCALVFLWSPAHFWALAIARRDEYAAAGFPTPVSASGEGYTGLLVVLYAASTVAVSLLPSARGDFGGLYLAAAAFAGVALGAAAVRTWRVPGARGAWLLHRASGAYLAVILAAMVVDRAGAA